MNLARFIARRYMRSHASHTVINHISRVSIIAMAAPVAAMIVLMSVFNGLEDMTRRLYVAVDADVKVLPAEGTTFVADDALFDAIGSVEGVECFAAVLEQGALVEYDGSRTIVRVKGVDSLYKRVVPIAERVVAGTFTTQMEQNDCLVAGYGVIYSLQLSRGTLGKELSLYAINRTRFSSLLPVGGYTRRDMPLTGVFSVDESYANTIYTSLRGAQQLFNYPDRLSAVEVRVREGADADAVAEALQERLPDRRVQTREQGNSIYRLMALEKWGVFFIAALILAIASLSIVGTLVMVIIDKRDDVATLRTMGMTTPQVRDIFLAEGHIMARWSMVIGVVVGVALALCQQYFGLVRLNAATLMVDAYPVRLNIVDVVFTVAIYMAISSVITRLTVRRMI